MIRILKHTPEYEVTILRYEDITLEELANIANDETQEALLDGDSQEATIIRRIQ